MTLIANCLAKLVRQGVVSQKAADDAQALYEGIQGRLYPHMPPGSADAASALEAARAMAKAAQERKLQVAMTAIRQAEGLERIRGHSKGKVAGVMSLLTRDIHDESRGLNVDAHSQTITGALFREANTLLERYSSKAGGLSKDIAGMRNVVRELYGADTGDAAARSAAQGWQAAVDLALKRVTAGGKRVPVLDDWRLPQFWESARVRSVGETDFTRDIDDAIRGGSLTLLDRETGKPANDLQRPAIVKQAYENITTGRHSASRAGGFSSEMRIFRFNDAETWLRFQDKYGAGRGGVYNMMLGHVNAMAREIALVEVLGPNHRAVFRKMMEEARTEDAGLPATQRIRFRRIAENPRMAEKTYEYLTGQLGIPESEFMAGLFGGLRNLSTSANLGSAVVSAVPGDTVTAVFAANYNGIPATRVLARAVSQIAGDADKRALASQMNVVSHSIIDAALGAKRFEDQVVGEAPLGRLASFVVRSQGLQAWTEGMKRAFSMEFLGYVARQTDRKFGDLDQPFKNFLRRYGFTPKEWETMRQAQQIEADGARFFDISAVEDRRLGDRLMGAIIDERRFAVLEPDARISALTTGGLQRGTFWGEAVRSTFLFKSFAISILLTHINRSVTQGTFAQRATRLAAFTALMTVGGAAAMQAKQMIAGKDPRDMSDPRFWGGAFAQGGAFGIYGDLLYSASSRSGFGLTETLAGPVAGELTAQAERLAGSVRRTAGGEDVNWGREIARFMERWTPGSNLWYARLAADRYVFDQIQMMADPQYLDSFYRQRDRIQDEFGQQYWFGPGETRPRRAPDLGAAIQ